MANQILGTIEIADQNKATTITLNGADGNIVLGGGGHDGDLLMKNSAGNITVGVNGQLGAVHLGGTGQDGDLLLRASNNQNTIRLDGGAAQAVLGGGGRPGQLVVTNTAGATTLLLDGQSGEIRIRDWRITVPDYVFEEGYDLRAPAELRAFIAKNRHLPEVPRAAEIAEAGVDLTSFCMTLLKKIEELTLYTLRQDEALQCLSRRIAALEGPTRTQEPPSEV